MSFLIYKVKTTSLLSQAIRKKETATENRSGWHTVGAQQNSGPPSPFPATLGFREPLFCSSPDSHLSPNPIVSTDQGMVRASPICLCPPQNQQQGQGQPLREVPGRAPARKEEVGFGAGGVHGSLENSLSHLHTALRLSKLILPSTSASQCHLPRCHTRIHIGQGISFTAFQDPRWVPDPGPLTWAQVES